MPKNAKRTMPRTNPTNSRPRRWLRWTILGISLVFVALLPVPWLVARTPNPPGMAWRLDGRLQFDGETIDPPGMWIGLTAGRPPVVAEVVRSWLDPATDRPRDMRGGSTFHSPAVAEPAAIAIGLAHAGRLVDLSTIVEARQPLVAGLPAQVSVSMINGHVIVSQDDWASSIAALSDHNEFVSADGHIYDFDGTDFPYRVVDMINTPTDLEVSLAGWGRLIPVGWYRNLALGNSHGLLLGLAAYSHASGEDLARGRVIGGTGVLRGDGTVAPVGGLAAKTQAAHRAGVDVLVYPADQRCLVEVTLDRSGGMAAVPVASLSEAIALLRDDIPVPIHDPNACPV
jgi:Lon protease (S16) C-terminal proteolytic domain